jgi:surface polysaccharide O-acyltransferase-like enzyme
MNRDDSTQINLLRFPLIAGVVLVHAHSLVGLSDGAVSATSQYPVAQFSELLVVHVLGQSTAPMFFLFAGYLLYRSAPLTRTLWLSKLKHRFTTLGLPYLCWNGAVFLLFCIAQSVPRLQPFFTRADFDIRSIDWWQRADLLLGITRFPIVYPLWFLRDLLLLAAVSPLIWLMMKYLRIPALALFCLLWTGLWGGVPWSQAMALFFFSIGIALGQDSGERVRIPSHAIFVIMLVVLAFIEAVMGREFSSDSHRFSVSVTLLHKTATLVGICAGWRLAIWLQKIPSVLGALLFLQEYAFFTFAAHEPLLTVLRKLGFRILGHDSSAKLLAIYFGSVGLTLLLCVCTGILVHRLMPSVYGVLTGGRRATIVEPAILTQSSLA